MVSSSPKKIGGEMGDVRANIDEHKLNEYLVVHVPAVRAPVSIKQFKVMVRTAPETTYLRSPSLDRCELLNYVVNVELNTSIVKPHIFLDRCRVSTPTLSLRINSHPPTDSGKRSVLRKKPAGQLLSKTAHQVEREYTVLAALQRHNSQKSTKPEQRVPVPIPYVLCEDSSIIGTPFYIMEFLDGRIFTDSSMPGVPRKEQHEWYVPNTAHPNTVLNSCRFLSWLAAVRALAALSSLSPHSIGLSSFGSSKPYFPRQLKSLGGVSKAQAAAVDVDTNVPIGPIPGYDALTTWYAAHLPDETKLGPRIVHGDYKLDNLVFHPTESRVIGILDWELCTIGSPVSFYSSLYTLQSLIMS
jgi:aminoglycoside phosphotransferase (APT) family kinase protein